ncbi:WcaF family extracellular polysaccharide biosynthesis acetyltransferase [Ferruginibacter yonginensis]|uniref:WcaF family extracellular polysaccharide biosynthesis acetyltransferase n=1 Tax=Ferruginibacter yonginensis TaxID=1310416 RepID=A0ABV8QQS0_9BACT
MKQVDLSTFNNQWYQPGSPIKRLLWYFINVVFFKSSCFPFYALKTFLLRLFGATVGKGVCIKPCVNIKYPWLLTIGDYVWIGEQVWIDNLAKVTIGNHVCISQNALLLCGNHDYTSTQFDLIVKPIVIEDGAWIGAQSTVCGGAHCATHTVVALGAVLVGDTTPYAIYKGNPAVKVKDRVIV